MRGAVAPEVVASVERDGDEFVDVRYTLGPAARSRTVPPQAGVHPPAA